MSPRIPKPGRVLTMQAAEKPAPVDPFDPGPDPLAPEAGEPAELLDDIRKFIGRFCQFPDDHCLAAVALWAAHTHMIQHFHTTPRLALLSPEPGSGKTRVLEILDLLAPASLLCLSASPASIFRTLNIGPVTLLLDECDTIFAQRGKDDANEDLRALLNAGYRRGATIPRCVGPRHDVEKFPVFSAVALAGLGDLPDTILSRSVIIRMRRRAPGEPVEPFRHRQHADEGHALRDRLSAWAADAGEAAGRAWPDLPPGIEDRAAELWEPLLAVADAAGDDWPDRARAACVALAAAALDRKASLGVRLLADLRILFSDADAVGTSDLIQRLCAPSENGLGADAPWAELVAGKPINARGLASRLGRYGIKPQKLKIAGVTTQGYHREALWDSWQRYLSPPPGNPPPAPPAPLLADLLAFKAGAKRQKVGEVGDSESHPEPPAFPETRMNTGVQAEGGAGGVGGASAGVREGLCPACGGAGCRWCSP